MNIEQELRDLIEAVASIDPRSENPEDPTVMISGFGSMLLSQLKKDVASKLDDLGKRAKKDDFSVAFSQIVEKGGILSHKIQAIRDAESAMNKPQWKRKITQWKKNK